MLINFTKFTEKQSYRNLFFDTILGLKFKKRLANYRWSTISAKYSLFAASPQPQNILVLSSWPWLFSDDKLWNFQSKCCGSLQVRINKIEFVNLTRLPTAQKMKFSINAFFSKCYQIRRKLENGKLHFCAVIMKEWGGCKEKLLPLVQWNKYAPL